MDENIKIVKMNDNDKSSIAIFSGIWVAIIAKSRSFSTTVRVEERKEERKANSKVLSNREIERIKKKVVK